MTTATPLSTKQTSKSITLFADNAGIAFQNEGRMCLPRFELKLTVRYDPTGLWSKAIGIIASIKALVLKVIDQAQITRIGRRGKRQTPLSDLKVMEDSFNELLASQSRSAQSPLARGAGKLYTVYRLQLTRVRRMEDKPTLVEWVTHLAWSEFSMEQGDRVELVSNMGLEGEEKELFSTQRCLQVGSGRV